MRPSIHVARKVIPSAVALSFSVFWSCSRFHSPAPSIDGEVREYIRLAVALGERDPDGLDYYYGPADWVADIRRSPPTLSQIRMSAETAITKLNNIPGVRQRFLVGQLRAIEARADLLLGVKRSFDDESQAFFGIRPSPAGDGRRPGALRKQLEQLLSGRGKLANRYESFEAKFTIAPARLPGVMARALQACRAQTAAHIGLPPGESVSIEYVTNRAWSAYSYYHGNFHSLIRINADFGLTVDRALQLACHEGYPGHHVINLLTDQNLVRAANRLEFLVQPTFSPQSFLSEAAATMAPEIAFPEADRIRLERDVLFPLAGLPSADAERYVRIERLAGMLYPEELAIARDYLDGKLEFVRAANALEDRALMAHAEATLRYLNEYRSYVMTYTAGLDRVRNWIDARTVKSADGGWGPFMELMTYPERF